MFHAPHILLSNAESHFLWLCHEGEINQCGTLAHVQQWDLLLSCAMRLSPGRDVQNSMPLTWRAVLHVVLLEFIFLIRCYTNTRL